MHDIKIMKFWKGIRKFYVKSNFFLQSNKKQRNTNLDKNFMDWWRAMVPEKHKSDTGRAQVLRQMIRYENCCIKFRRTACLDPNPRDTTSAKIKMHSVTSKGELSLSLRQHTVSKRLCMFDETFFTREKKQKVSSRR